MSGAVLTPNAWLRWDLVRRELDELAPTSVLEVGMGLGALGTRLARTMRYVGIERDDDSRAIANERLGGAGRVLADVSELDPDERFDVLCSFEVLEHIDDDVGALRSWVEHLRPGGHVLVSVPAHQERFAAADVMAGHIRRYSRDGLRATLTGAGLEVVRISAVGFPLGHVLEWGRNRLAARTQREDESASLEERTAKSARRFQPPAWAGLATQAGTAPFRWMQRPFEQGERATGWVGVAVRPPA